MDKLSKLSNPKYGHLKNTFEIIDKRINSMEARKIILPKNGNIGQYNHMKAIRKRVLTLLKSHKLFNELEFSFKIKSDPIYGDISDETLKVLANLSKPRIRDLKSTLMKINKLISDDYYFKENRYKSKRFDELLEYRKNVCCLISNFKFPSDSRICYRFAPCDKKYINIWEIPKIEKPNSRILKFDFDESTIKLANPRHLYVKNRIVFFKNLKFYYMRKLKENVMMEQKEMLRLNTTIERINEKLILLQKLDRNVDDQDLLSLSEDMIQSSKVKYREGYVLFTNPLELPTKRRLVSTLGFYNFYLDKLIKAEKIKKEGNPFIERIQRNILFSQNLLKNISKDEDDVDDQPKQIKFLQNFYGKSGRITRYVFDEKTNQISFPRLGNMENALEKHEIVVEKIKNDIKVAKMLRIKTGDEELNMNSENKGNIDLKYEKLLERMTRLRDKISKKKEIIESLQNSPSKIGLPTMFYHHKSCFKEEQEKFASKYKATNPHMPVSTSKPKKKYLLYAFLMYEKWIHQRKSDIKYNKEIEFILKSQEDSNLTNVDQKISKHTKRMMDNKIRIEAKLDETDENIENSAENTNKNSKTQVDSMRITKLAMPKKSLLMSLFLQYSYLMSENKRKNIQCKLQKDVTKPEHIEKIYRQHGHKEKQHKRKSNSDEFVIVYKLFNSILNDNYKTFEKLIQFSVFQALTFQKL